MHMICPYFIYCPLRDYDPYLANRFAYSRIKSDPYLTVTVTKITKSDDKIKEYLQIPVFYGPIDSKTLENINSNIKSDILEFKEQMEESAEDNAETLKKQGKAPNPYQISNTYSITYNKNYILSLLMIYYINTSGKISYIKTTYNYNLETGESMPLSDLFKQNVDYMSILSSKARQIIQLKYPSAAANFKGLAIDQPYYFDNNNLLFISFNKNSPILVHMPVISIPLQEIRNILKSQLLR